MRDALLRISLSYHELVGSSKIILLFVISMLALILIDENEEDFSKRRRMNPAVFLLSLWSGISYTFVRLFSGRKRAVLCFGLIFAAVSIYLSGSFVISEEAYHASVYYYTNNLISVLSVVCILSYFVIYYMISRQLFTLKQDRAIYMVIILWLHLFDFYSEKAAGFSLFLSPVTISSIVIHDLLPLLLWLYLIYEEKIKEIFVVEESDDTDIEEIPEEWDMKKHKILNIRNMAIAFALLLVLFVASVFVLNNKINSLYDATVVLENAANTKMSVYELKGDDEDVLLTVMVSPEGTVTVVGGGSETEGVNTYEFIKKYTDKVDKWYLYGDDDENKGAYDFCKDKGLKITETYVISGVEKL